MFCQGQFVGVEIKPFPKLWKWAWVPSLLECLEVLWIPSPLSLLAGCLLMQAVFSCLHDSSKAALKESTALFWLLILFTDILLVSRRSVYSSLFCRWVWQKELQVSEEMNVMFMFRYDSRLTIGVGRFRVILKSPLVTPRKGVPAASSSVALLLLTWLGTACSVVQVQLKGSCSGPETRF